MPRNPAVGFVLACVFLDALGIGLIIPVLPGLIGALTEMRGELSPEEAELRELTDSALGKLQAMSDAEFAELELFPDFDE